ncbi:MAG: hypothetical protein JW731_14185 [Bacteroidales bacterium]|nr:hypothetical protein [Bacteroidales bacterium]
MHKIKFIFTLLLILTATVLSAQYIHHEISAKLDIPANTITVKDMVTIPSSMVPESNTLTFSLNKHLVLAIPDIRIQVSGPHSTGGESIYETYLLSIIGRIEGDLVIPFEYTGLINDQIKEGAAEYARGFSETTGIICKDGVYLGGSTYWLPEFEQPLFTYNLEVSLQKEWSVISQGTRTKNNLSGSNREVRYESPNPDEEAYLIAGPFTEYEQPAGEVAVQAFLRTPDEELANRYIGITSQYLQMYESLIGPYPYTKFALVENFWETGYGMPSFTLLGEKVIRLPFILYTSYPHELLHNWWGNSVYVAMESGNWCEGLTAYMADHMLKEQQGQGAEYRQTTLQKFTDYVNADNDFPLVDFRSRNNSAEEAIGYGKCLMVNHMLRHKVGDEKYIDAYREFYKENKFKIASWDDIRASFKKVTGTGMDSYFQQWLYRKGAPELLLSNVKSEQDGEFYQIHFTLEQVQDEDPFLIDIPVAIFFEDGVETKVIEMGEKKQECNFTLKQRPVRLEVDPQFDIFRKLDKAEVPPALSQVFGSADAIMILPAESPYLGDYKTLADTWKSSQETQGKTLKVVLDSDVQSLPNDKSVWVMGYENKFAHLIDITKDYATSLSKDDLDKIAEMEETGSLVYAMPNPENNVFSLGFVATKVKEAVPGLTRLLTHYGKYSYLGFEGDRPNNVLKGTFPALHSPLHMNILYDGEIFATNGKLEPEPPLINQ